MRRDQRQLRWLSQEDNQSISKDLEIRVWLRYQGIARCCWNRVRKEEWLEMRILIVFLILCNMMRTKVKVGAA